MGDISTQPDPSDANGTPKKHILLNAFDMSTVGHLSPGQWKVRILHYSSILIQFHGQMGL